MYVEISGRRTGKTTRLRNELKNYLEANENNKAVILCPLQSMIAYNYKDLISKYKNRLLTNYSFPKKSLEDYRWFYDEFDRIIDRKYWYIDNDGYYCTTPVYLRTAIDIVDWKQNKRYDFLLNIIDNNNYIYNKYVCADVDKEWKLALSTEEYNTEVNGDWI